MDLGGKPVEQAIACQRLVAERRDLDLRGLDGIPVHTFAERSLQQRPGDRAATALQQRAAKHRGSPTAVA